MSGSVRGTAPTGGHGPEVTRYAGWAMEAYPGESVAFLQGEMQRQVSRGANVVWLGHDNPGEVGYGKREPGLSYAVWASYRDSADPHHADAVAMVEAQKRALRAARAAGIRVVLPIGYQIQMGQAWNSAHPQDLRRAADGSLYDASGGPNNSASFYAPDYRRAILAYYRWIDSAFVRPYAGTILMLNLADEPEDGDYSSWADQAFQAGHGYGLFEAGADPRRQEAVGRFESDYIAEYAAWSARQWLRIEPSMPVTMSFCGGYSRYTHEGPNLESVFRKTPRNFSVTFDAYPRDGPYDTPLREGDLIALFTLVRTLGYYSAVYRRPLWLWSAANSWGLNEASADPGGIADAVANGIYDVELARQTGGDLRGVAVWNYNVRGQGLYNDTHHLSYDPDRMFARVSASFDLLRGLMAAPVGRPDTVILAPDAAALQAAGAQRALRATDSYRWDALAALARSNVAAVALTRLKTGRSLPFRTALVLARRPVDLTAGDRDALRQILARGGTVIAAAPVATNLAHNGSDMQLLPADRPAGVRVGRYASRLGTLLAVDGGVVEDLLADASARWAAPIWLRLLHRSVPTSGYVVSTGGTTLWYTMARGGASMPVSFLPSSAPGDLHVFDARGTELRRLRAPSLGRVVSVLIARRSYALLVRTGRHDGEAVR